jgi:NSS family neurotransmitter:Na+ symporter
MYFVVVAGLWLVYWWLSRGYSKYPWFDERGQWNLLDVYSNATVVTQWLLVILAGLILNNLVYKKMIRKR